ncbi:MAG: glycosyltransferase involved in cell wall biosynthesis [Porticoccus sp.]|jgi:glycosyltransferase involved in cell wall biosynthesis|uniref:glycosyltransferase family 2 protein n=1 Tax=Porticoccus sp. TaxID=2024853 RepID=UPI0039E52A47
MTQQPLVTIITAAYNRANVLRYALLSVMQQTYQNWEYLVVGDGCTDDTESLIRGIDDPRVQFINLKENSGGQSAPHNHGLSLAQGEYIFYLNQDDFYFPDHIASRVDFLRQSGADITWGPVALPSPAEEGMNWAKQSVMLGGVTRNNRFDPTVFVISSCWAMRADTAQTIGLWKPAEQTLVSPSQELLFRASRMGADIQFHPRISILCIYSGARVNSYLSGDAEHQYYFDFINSDPEGRSKIAETAALTLAGQRASFLRLCLDVIKYPVSVVLRAFLQAIGKHPLTINYYLRYRRYGGFVSWHRKKVLKTS